MNYGVKIICSAVCALALLCSSAALAQQPDTFAQAHAEYAAGRFREAADLYTQMVESGVHSATVFYNLGNAWFRAGEPGRAVLNYERALALDPEHPEAAANLTLVREKARGLELKKTWRDQAALRITSFQYTVAAAVSFWVAAFGIAVLMLRRRRSAALGAVVVLAALVCGAAIAGLYTRETGVRGRALAIVVEPNVAARLATADSSATVLALPPGSEINILNSRGDWMYAALPNDLRGWIPSTAAERVRL
jgi:tetratricopeptide (TPR) repeat protein